MVFMSDAIVNMRDIKQTAEGTAGFMRALDFAIREICDDFSDNIFAD